MLPGVSGQWVREKANLCWPNIVSITHPRSLSLITIVHEDPVWDIFSLMLCPLSSTELWLEESDLWLASLDYFCPLALAWVWLFRVSDTDWDRMLYGQASFLYLPFYMTIMLLYPSGLDKPIRCDVLSLMFCSSLPWLWNSSLNYGAHILLSQITQIECSVWQFYVKIHYKKLSSLRKYLKLVSLDRGWQSFW